MKARTEVAHGRRTQAARSAATRELLLDATVACLVELGWSGTSTTEVVRRAGVSRGAQVHHYPTKDDLVFAAVEHVLDRRIDEYRVAFADIPAHERTVGAAFDLLWAACMSGETFDAWLEIAVAARTDPALHARFVELESRFHATTLEIFTSMFPETDADPELARTGLDLAFSVLDGMAISRLTGMASSRIDNVGDIFKLLVAPYFPLSGGNAADPAHDRLERGSA